MLIKLSAVYALSPQIKFDIVIKSSIKEAFDYMQSLGYEGVEINIPNPFKVDVKLLKEVLTSHEMEVSAISTGLSYLTYGYSLSSTDENNRIKALEFFHKYIDLSEELECRKVVIGLARGRCREEDYNRARNKLIDSMINLDDYAETKDVTLLLEPLNRYETNIINKISEALEIIKMFKNVKLLLDTFHTLLEERNVYDAIDLAAPYLGHVHFADSNRLAPGLGMLDWEKVIFRLIRGKYRGFISIEARTEPDFRHMLEISMRTLKPLLI